MALGFGTVLAQPTATPPSGTVSPNFSSVNVSGATTSGSLNVSGAATVSGTLTVPSITGSGLVTLGGNGVDVNVGDDLFVDGDISAGNGVFEAAGPNGGNVVVITGQTDISARTSVATSDESWAFSGTNTTTQNNKSAIKGAIANSLATVIGYLGWRDSTGVYGLYTPNKAKVGDTLTVSGNTILNDNVSNSSGALVLNDDVQVGLTSTSYPMGYVAKLFTGALSSVTYATNAEFGNFDIASTDDLFVDDKAFVGTTITAGGDISAIDDVVAGDNISAGGDISASGDITAIGAIGAFYSRSAYISMDTTGILSVSLGCASGDVVVACSGRIEDVGALYIGAKPVTSASPCTGDQGNASAPYVCFSPSTPGCQAYGGKGTGPSGADLNVYTFCFSPNG